MRKALMPFFDRVVSRTRESPEGLRVKEVDHPSFCGDGADGNEIGSKFGGEKGIQECNGLDTPFTNASNTFRFVVHRTGSEDLHAAVADSLDQL